MKKWTKGLFLLMSLFLIQSCVKDIQDIENIEVENWQPNVALALVNTTVSIHDLLDNFDTGGYLNVDDDNFMTLVYQGNVFSAQGKEVFSMPDFSIPMIDTSMVLPYGAINTPFDIDFFSVKNGQLDYSFESPYTEDMNVIIEVQNLTKGGQILHFPMTVNYAGTSPMMVSGSIDLKGYIMDFANDEIAVKYIATNAAGDRKYLANMQLNFNSFEYNYAQGYFSQYQFDLPSDSLFISLFENAVAGNLHIQDPKMNLIIKNSFGLPIELTSENLEVATMSDGMMNIHTVLDNGVSFNFPSVMEAGQFKTTVIEINASNSNLSDVISSNPQQLNYKLNAMTNPLNDPNIKGFVMDTSRFDVDVELEIPVWLSASNFAVEEINEFDASFLDDVESAKFKLITENGMPVEAGVQVYFLDANNVVLDSLFSGGNQNLIPAAQVDSDGKVTASGMGNETVEINEARLQNFRNATQISIKGLVSTTDTGSVAVKFYTDYEMSFKLGVEAKLKQ
ncbi:MAG TPA: hypothetical protein ENJ53_02220 [Phaeodactylibacter sp.]|nr:hypothetical protein [Phaeodactylibacter sp.]